jgi:hypothetical protein
MTDIYAKAGIPVPKEDGESEYDLNEHAFLAEKPGTNEGPSDWRVEAEKQRDRDLRLECIKLSFEYLSGSGSALISTAEKVYDFVKNGPAEKSAD